MKHRQMTYKEQEHRLYEERLAMIENHFEQCKAILFKRKIFSDDEMFLEYFAEDSIFYSKTFDEIMLSYMKSYASTKLNEMTEKYKGEK